MPADYRYLLVDASTGANIGELPATPSSPYSRVLNGVGAFSCTVPRNHPICTYTNLQGDREITVLRNNLPVWNGPITQEPGEALSSFDLTLTAREASWYLSKRTLEVDKTYTGADLFDIVRDLITNMITKTSTAGDGTASAGLTINAGLPRFAVAPASALSGVTRDALYFGAARHVIADIVDNLIADPTTGLEYRMDYGTGSTRQTAQRTLTFGSPSLGIDQLETLAESVLTDFTKEQDRERAATRVHVSGQSYTKTLQNTGSILNTDILIESVLDRSDTSDQAAVDRFTAEFRRVSQPPVATYGFTWCPDRGPLTFDWCDPGDRIPMNVGTTTVLHSVGHLRVVQLDVMPPSGGSPETCVGVLNVPLDELGA